MLINMSNNFTYLDRFVQHFKNSVHCSTPHLRILDFQLGNRPRSVADPGLPVGGVHPLGGHRPLMWALLGENVCENERIGSHRGWRAPGTPPPPPDPPMQMTSDIGTTKFLVKMNVKMKEKKSSPFAEIQGSTLVLTNGYMGKSKYQAGNSGSPKNRHGFSNWALLQPKVKTLRAVENDLLCPCGYRNVCKSYIRQNLHHALP